MKMKSNINIELILSTIIFWAVAAKSVAKDGEIEVKLQFLEYELEDFCVSKNDAEWKFLNGSESDLKKLLDVELKESEFYKRELEVLQKHVGKKFTHKKLQRLMDLFSHPGAPLLGAAEFREYRDYTRKLQELTGTTKIPCSESQSNSTSQVQSNSSSSSEGKCSPIGVKQLNKILFSEKNEEKLRDWWSKWFRLLHEKNVKTKYDFVQQLSILDLEAEQNGEEELTEYWLKQADITWVDYETVLDLWKEILPLYEKLKQFMRSLVIQNYGKEVLRGQKIIPAHVLGSLESHNWITAAEKLGGFDGSEGYKLLKNSLKQRTVEGLYKMADNQTSELKLGHLPQSFYEKSRFNESSQTCQNKVMDYCERENVLRAMFCATEVPNVKYYIQINEDVMKLKYLMLSGKEDEEENGFLFREGPRDSVLHEAMQGLSSLRALWPDYLESRELLTNHSQQQKKILSLLITALHVIPPLPYYLATDSWRINALREIDASAGENLDTTTLSSFSSTTHGTSKREAGNKTEGANTPEGLNGGESYANNGAEPDEQPKTYDTQNLTRDWWNYREKFQGIGSPDGELYEDYLQDRKIIWNKSYLSKFLGRILQFQILEKTGNLTANLSKIQRVLQKGKSDPWQLLVEQNFNITEISVKPFLNYFKPLEEFLDRGTKLKNQTQLFSFDDFNFVSQGFSLNPKSNEAEGEQPAEGSDALFLSLAVIAAVGIIALIVTIGRRRYKRRQEARQRKRRLAEL